MPHEKHRSSGPAKIAVTIVTVSTSRFASMQKGTKFSDESGDVAEKEVEKLG